MLIDHSSGERKEDEYYKRYDTHFTARKEDTLRLLEIGIQTGGSLRMWQKFFPNATIYGVDNDPVCAELRIPGVEIHIGDQTDVRFLERFSDMDIIIDDGGHTMIQQQTSFTTLFPLMNRGGIYVIEDLHTSYWGQFQDGEKTTDFIARLINELNYKAQGSDRSSQKPENDLQFPIAEIHNYESMCFIYKK